MSKLEELRQQIATMFEQSTEKEDIEKLAALNNAIDGVAKEQEAIESKNAELIKSYKDLVKHTSFKDSANKPVDTISGKGSNPIDDALKATLNNL